MPEFGETIEARTALHNIGHLDAFGVTGELGTTSAYVAISQGSATFGDIPGGETSTNSTPFVFHITHDVPDGEALGFTLQVSEDPGVLEFDTVAHAPGYLIGVIDIDDSAGNGNGQPDPGETVALSLLIENTGGSPTPELSAALGSGSAYFLADPTSRPIGVLAPGEQREESGFEVTIDNGCPPVYTGLLRLVFSGPEHYTAAGPFLLCVGEIFADDMEDGSASWTHYTPSAPWTDQWHLETYRNHTYAGQTSWKCGGEGSLTYGNQNYALLETAPFELPAGARLEFWHWMDAEASAAYPDSCYDGGLLEISTDGGASWTQLFSQRGYTHLIRDGSVPGPFPSGTPVWSGAFDWTEEWVDLSGFEGPAQVRFAFGSDGADVREGWYVDDVRIVLPAASNASGTASRVVRPVLLPVAPNPLAVGSAGSRGGVTLRFALPQATTGSLAVFDAGGRLVRLLASGKLDAGDQRVEWDGRGANGRPVPAGTYYCRLSAGPVASTQRITVVW